MAKNNGNKQNTVISPHKDYNRGITNPDKWADDFTDLPFYTIVEKLLEVSEKFAEMLTRASLVNERQANAIIVLADRFDKYNDTRHMKMLVNKLASTIGMGGVGRLEALFGVSRLLAPDMYRVAKGLPRNKDRKERKEEVMQSGGPDFREEREE